MQLLLEAPEVPAHSDIASFGISLRRFPSLHADTVKAGHGAGAIRAALAMKEDRIVGRILQHLEVLVDSGLGNLRPGFMSLIGM
jgi:hypothetical protein